MDAEDEDFKKFLEFGDHYNNYLGLNLDDPVSSAFNDAFFYSQHLTEKGKKTTVRKYEKELDKLTEQALELSETIKSLKSTYRMCLACSLRGQHRIPINSANKIDYFLQSLAKASQSVKEVKLKPITNGFYNAFLFEGVNKLLSHIRLTPHFAVYIHFEKAEASEDIAKRFLLDFWEANNYTNRIREIAVKIIITHLSASSKDKRAAQKAIDNHLISIVNERIQSKCKLLVDEYNRIFVDKTSLFNEIERV